MRNDRLCGWCGQLSDDSSFMDATSYAALFRVFAFDSYSNALSDRK